VGKSRAHGRRNWPEGLYERRRGRRVYYGFQIPGTTREVSLGSDLAAAKQAASIYLSRQAPDPIANALNRIERPSATVAEHFAWFAETELPERRTRTGKSMAAKTLYEYRAMLDHAAAHLGAERAVAEITRRAIAELLESYPPRMSNRYRSLLSQVFRHAVARGLRTENPVDATIARKHGVQRRRLDKPAFDAIHEAGEPWLKRAMDVALWSLQRREDVVSMRVEHWAEEVLSVRQRKVEGHGTGLLRITPGDNLRAALAACLDSPEREDCPFLLHRKPIKRIKAGWRVHPYQLAGEMISREFTRLRDELELYNCDSAERPTWHEIRALGGDFYREQFGWANEQVQALMGHSTVAMTKAYLDRHGERWQDVSAG
jgi:integrase